MKCPYCGKEFIWGSDNTLDEVGILPEGTEDSATASNYSCDNCGAGAMVWECQMKINLNTNFGISNERIELT